MNIRPGILQLRRAAFLLALGAVVLFAGVSKVMAERYLTPAEARKLCFPAADTFEELVVRFTKDQVQAISTAIGTRVRNLGNRCHVARRQGQILGVLVVDHVLGKHELIDYAVAIGTDGQVLQIEVLEYRESHGMEIRGEKWRGQFTGKKPSDKLRFHGNIYNISGATISCRNITEGVQRVLATFDLVLRSHLGLGNNRMQNPPAAAP